MSTVAWLKQNYFRVLKQMKMWFFIC